MTIPDVKGDESLAQRDDSPIATDKQKTFARQLGIEFDERISRSQLSKLIDNVLGKQVDDRYDRLSEVQRREGDFYEKLREEIAGEIDADDPRLSVANPEQVVAAFEERGQGAILLTFDPDDIGDLSDLTGFQVQVQSSDNVDIESVKAILQWLGIAMFRR